jgi:c-di-GMP-binding flagellar brake protein YcgR
MLNDSQGIPPFLPICVTLSPRMTAPKDDRRSRQRIPASVPVTIKAPQGNLQLTGQTRDLSSSGIFLYTSSNISEGSELEMVLILPPELTQGEKRWVCCQASVVRVEDRKDGNFGVAARIRNMDVLPEILG